MVIFNFLIFNWEVGVGEGLTNQCTFYLWVKIANKETQIRLKLHISELFTNCLSLQWGTLIVGISRMKSRGPCYFPWVDGGVTNDWCINRP